MSKLKELGMSGHLFHDIIGDILDLTEGRRITCFNRCTTLIMFSNHFKKKESTTTERKSKQNLQQSRLGSTNERARLQNIQQSRIRSTTTERRGQQNLQQSRLGRSRNNKSPKRRSHCSHNVLIKKSKNKIVRMSSYKPNSKEPNSKRINVHLQRRGNYEERFSRFVPFIVVTLILLLILVSIEMHQSVSN